MSAITRVAASCAILPLCCLACSAPQVVDPDGDRYAQAVQARDQGKLAQAEQIIAPSAAKGGLQANLLLAEVEILRGKHRAAAERLIPLAAQNPRNSAVAGALARALDGTGQTAEAIVAYRQRLALAPDDVDAARRLAELLLGTGRAQAASEVAQEATVRHPKSAQAHALLARALLARGRLPLALESARQATRLDSRSVAAWLQLARALTLGGELDPAVEAYGKLLELDPQHSAGLAGLAGVHIEQRKWAQAIAVLKRAVKVHPDSATNWNAMAVCRSRIGEHEGAVQAMNRALEAAPGNRLLRRNLVEVLLDAGRTEQAAAAAMSLHVDGQSAARPVDSQQTEQALLERAVVADVLAGHACARTRGNAGKVEAEIVRRLEAVGMTPAPTDLARVAAEVLPQVRVARARCKSAKTGPPPRTGVAP